MPVRCAVPVFAATVTLTVPLPVLRRTPTVNHAALLVRAPRAGAARGHRDRDALTRSGRRPAGRCDRERAGRTGLRDAEGLAGNGHRAGALRGPGICGDDDVDAAIAGAAGADSSTTRRCWWCSRRRCCPWLPRPPTLSPAAGEVRLVGAIVNVHGAPACVTLKVWPAIVTDPVRCAVPVLRRR